MSDNLDLEQIITDSVNDAVSGVEDVDTSSDEPAVEASPEPAAAVEDDGTGQVEDTPAPTSTQVAAPGSEPAADAAAKDPFESLVGMSKDGVTGRENRIPYSRVKKITEKAALDAETKIAETVLGRKLAQGEKAEDVVKQHIAQLPELQTRVQDYEGRLNTVGQFENVMANDPEKFLTMLAKLPAYKQFFNFVETAYNTMSGAPAGAPAAVQPQVQQPLSDDMPQPDEKLPDGSAVYSMDGLKKLVEWTQAKARTDAVAEASKQFEGRYNKLEQQYEPIRKAWQEHQTRQSVLPMIQAQIAEAKTWPLFNELEPEITKLLEQDKNLSLEAAYRRLAFPKLITERNTMRQNIIKELQTTPANTSVAGRGTTRPNAPVDGPRSIEDIIRESVEQLGSNARS